MTLEYLIVILSYCQKIEEKWVDFKKYYPLMALEFNFSSNLTYIAIYVSDLLGRHYVASS